ncbi:MAG: Acyl dehydratase [Rhodospirillaceae bacterium]|nr:MAG: Acyl dehydratase [Rhodospirillaceae bacterium]
MIDELNGLYFEDLTIGLKGVFARTVTEADIVLFAGVSGDNSPVHLNEEYAKKTRFKTRIAHGSLCGAYVSACMAMRMPGPGCIYISQSLKFLAPVHIGDTVVVRVEVIALDEKKKLATIDTRCFVEQHLVVEGEAVILMPTRD